MSDFNEQVLTGLKNLYKFRKEAKGWLREGRCPDCKDWSLYTATDDPKMVKCDHSNRCRFEISVRKALPDLFDDWSKRFKQSNEQPNAAADNYLRHGRGLDVRLFAGSYTQDHYVDRESGATSATVRFTLPNGAWWERIIDRPWRFGDKKANFAWGKSYKGQAWLHPKFPLEALAQAEEIWLVEGIFDCCALVENGVCAVSLMSTNNYPDALLAELRQVARNGHLPNLVWAFDQGESGLRESRKGMARAKIDGWKVAAAQTTPDGEGEKEDWNDLHLTKKLTPDHVKEYRWNGDFTFETISTKKARLFYEKTAKRAFYITINNQFYWCSVRARSDDTGQEHSDKMETERISDFAFRVLYRIWNEDENEAQYAVSIKFPYKDQRRDDVITIPSAALSASGDFKKHVLKVAAIWKGNGNQLDHIFEKMDGRKKTVLPVPAYGYAAEHQAWVFNDIAVRKGVIKRLNAHEFFEFDKISIRLASRRAQFQFALDVKNPQPHNTGWYQHLATAFQARGIITLAWWTMSFFATQIRARNGSLGFLEMAGQPNTGKTTLIKFLWQLSGRIDDYEGIDPSKASVAALNRNFARYANVPIVLMEGDRETDKPHNRAFDFNELKPLWTGAGLAERGVRNSGNETYAPPFRAAILIEQNAPVSADEAVMQRIMHLRYDSSHFSPATAEAVTKLRAWPAEAASGWLIHVIRQEKTLLENFFKRVEHYQARIIKETGVNIERLIINHAQLAAAVDMLKDLLPMQPHEWEAATNMAIAMTPERQIAVSSENPLLVKFWEYFDYLESRETEATVHHINSHRKHETLIAVNMPHFESRCRSNGLAMLDADKLVRVIKSSKRRKFLEQKAVNPRDGGKSIHCWVFQRAADELKPKPLI